MGKLNGLDLFSGYGGLTIALNEWVNPVAYCEIEKYCQGILLSKMDDGEIPTVPICTDIKELAGSELPGVDIVYGGFPCQDLSVAGNGKGLAGERSGLFYEIIRLAKEIQPQFIFLENVPGIRRKALHTVGWELANVGYDCRWLPLSVAQVGAPHKRERWFCLAYSCSERRQQKPRCARRNEEKNEGWPEKENNKLECFSESDGNGCASRMVANARGERLEGHWVARKAPEAIHYQGFAPVGTNGNLSRDVSYSDSERFGREAIATTAKDNERIRESDGRPKASPFEHSWWSVEPDVGRVVDGCAFRVDRIKALGNGVVPLQAKTAFKILMGL